MRIEIAAPMPGTVAEILVDIGDKVEIDDELVVIEAMKMEIPVCSTTKGTIYDIRVKLKDKIETDQVLVVLE
ncbi:MAG: acetyl-CoA carboxylase biotin carboxyl carrier protein subunit [Deltaproteobacteria bacterium]|nr:acetyl-CoA carboxylase biotin carboxyl carrier protein subunit [Deltaproteobacteria bacterium]